MNTSRASFSPTTRFVLTVGAIYGALSLGCVLDDNPDGDNNNPGGGGGGDNNNPTCVGVVDGSTDFTEDVELCEDVTVNGNIRLSNNASLTIKPGTTLTMCADCYIEVGAFSQAATILAEGTAEAPITIKGATEEAGFWDAIYIQENTTSNSTLTHVVIQDGGGNGADAALEVFKDITLDNVTIRDSDSSGFLATGLSDDSTALVVEGVAGWAGVLRGADAVTNLPLDGTYTEGIGEGAFRVELDGVSGEDVVFSDAGLPYFVQRNIRVSDGGSVTVGEGVTLQMNVDTYIEVGAFGQAASFNVEGTSAAPVVIEGAAQEPGFWDGIYVNDSTTSASAFDHLTIRHGGGGTGPCLTLDKDIDVKNTTIEACETAGFSVSDAGFGDGSEVLTVTGVEGPAGLASWPGALTIPKGGAFTGNDDDEIRVNREGNSSGNLPALGVPYVATANWRLSDGAEVTIDPGVEIQFGPDAYIEIGAFGQAATFVAAGAQNEPIIFTGADASAGTWQGIFVNDSASTASRFDFVQVSFGGDAGGANLEMDADVEVTNSVFSDSLGYGIIVGATAGSRDYAATNTFSNNAAGDIDDRRN
jgi:hypothetical protein